VLRYAKLDRNWCFPTYVLENIEQLANLPGAAGLCFFRASVKNGAITHDLKHTPARQHIVAHDSDPWQQFFPAKAALEQFGTYDFQRDKATNTSFSKYAHAANYAVGVYMAGAGYGKWESVKIAQTYGYFRSLNQYDREGREWTEKGWEDAYRGDWKIK
jgi:hypothetical protein